MYEPDGCKELVEICKLLLEGKAICQCPDSDEEYDEDEYKIDHDEKIFNANSDVLAELAKKYGENFSVMFEDYIKLPLMNRVSNKSSKSDKIMVTGTLADCLKSMPSIAKK